MGKKLILNFHKFTARVKVGIMGLQLPNVEFLIQTKSVVQLNSWQINSSAERILLPEPQWKAIPTPEVNKTTHT